MAHEVAQDGHVRHQLHRRAVQAKAAIDVDALDVVADRFIYHADDDEYECPAGDRLIWRIAGEEHVQLIHLHWSSNCPQCSMKARCTTGNNRRVARWEHEHVVEAPDARLEREPRRMRARRPTAEHPFGTLKCWMGYTHFLTKTVPKVSTEMSLHVPSGSMKRKINILRTRRLIEAIATRVRLNNDPACAA